MKFHEIQHSLKNTKIHNSAFWAKERPQNPKMDNALLLFRTPAAEYTLFT